MGTGKTGAMMPAFLVWLIESLSFFNQVAIGPQTAEQFIALRTIACLQSDSLLTLHNWEAVRNTLIANINHINTHLRDNAEHAHQLTDLCSFFWSRAESEPEHILSRRISFFRRPRGLDPDGV